MSFPPPPPGPGGPDLTKPPRPAAPPPGGFGAPPPPGGFGAPPPPGGFGPPPAGFGGPTGFPPPAGYGGVGGYPPPTPTPSNGLAVAALVVGITSLVCLWPLGLVAVPLGIAGMSRAKRLGGTGRGMAIGGIVTGMISVLVAIALFALIVLGANEIDSDPSDGVCNEDRYLQDPDCGGFPTTSVDEGPAPTVNLGTADPDPGDDDGLNSDPPDGLCNDDRFLQDPDC